MLYENQKSIKNYFIKAAVITAAFFILAQLSFAQKTLSPDTNYLTDFGKMWTFDDLPLDYFKDKYNFEPTQEWIEKLQKSALQFGGGCSGAFLSADGLILTNHHCGRNSLRSVEKKAEDLLKNGFYAETLDEERKIEGLYVDQLMKIVDVTDEIIAAMDEVKSDADKVDAKNQTIDEMELKYAEETGLIARVITLYNGAKYSLYLYKRYNDIRVVMAPEFQIASTGWDWDNFTYPRYELDFMFFRAYDENGEPAKTDFHFDFNPEGPKRDEPIFIIGRPGDTDRQVSVAELKWLRDVRLAFLVQYLDNVYYAYYEMFKEHPERESELLNRVMGYGNSRKSLYGSLLGLQDETLMARKEKFEQQLIEKVEQDPELQKEYGHLWKALENVFNERTEIGYKEFLYNLLPYGRSKYLSMANDIYKLAEQLKLPEDERDEEYKSNNLKQTIANIYPNDFDEELNRKVLRAFVSSVYFELGPNGDMTQKLFNGKKGNEAVDYLLKDSFLENRTTLMTLAGMSGDEILNSNDKLIYFIKETRDDLEKIEKRNDELDETQAVLNQELGRLIVKLYGDQIPPDATATLRLSDGVLKSYEYNGTIAPPITTYYGMYDRYFSFDEKLYPWGLPKKWQSPPEGLVLQTPLDFAATLDIVGGNSGSSIVNQNAEVIGLVFDGNMESLAGDYLYMPENNRSVAVHAKGLITALKYVYKTNRLIDELLSGQLSK